MPFILGFDPGGIGNFGWCIADYAADNMGIPLPILHCGNADNAAEAVAAVAAIVGDEPVLAAGIDAPLFWIPNGWREVDLAVRASVHAAGGNPAMVMHVNALMGACLIQGVLIGRIYRDAYPAIMITEAHPGASLAILGNDDALAQIAFPGGHLANNHITDAAVAALTAKAMLDENPVWHNIYGLEHHPYSLLHGQLAYWIPL